MESQEPREIYEKINMFRSEKSGPFVNMFRMLASCIEQMSDADKDDCLQFILCHAHIGEWIATVLKGNSDHEWSETSDKGEVYSVDKLREALLPHADDATIVFLSHVTAQNLRLVTRVKELQDQIKKIIDKWPETHKQYVPKLEWNFESSYVPEWDLRKLLTVVKDKPELLGLEKNPI